MASSTPTPPKDGPRSTLSHDMGFVLGMSAHAFCDPVEMWTGFGPTLSELTFGLLGKSFRPERDIPDLAGKVILVTGGSAGLGKETILQLARHNPARIYLAARNETKSLDVIRSIKEKLPSSSSSVDIQYLQLDLASFASIKQATEHFLQNNTRLDRLVLNAGVMAAPPVTTPQGHELQLGTNHIGHFLLTKLLLPVLLKTAEADEQSDVRVVTVSSMASAHTPTKEKDLMNTISSIPALFALTTWQRYALSKGTNILFANELARRYPSLKSVSVHPGMVITELYDDTRATNHIAGAMIPLGMKLIFRSVRTGAWNQLWAAAGAKKEDLVNGAYYTPVGHANKKNRFVTDPELAKRLWEWTDEEVSKEY